MLELRLMVINFFRFDGRSSSLLSMIPVLAFSHPITSFMSRAIAQLPSKSNLLPSPPFAPSFHEEFYNTPRQRHVCPCLFVQPGDIPRCSLAVAIPANCVVFLMDSPAQILKMLQTGCN
jgi:hypothetical protein